MLYVCVLKQKKLYCYRIHQVSIATKLIENILGARDSNQAGQIEFRFGQVGSDNFDQKNCRFTGRDRVDLIQVGLSFGSNIIRFF
jgi:hypothetical protein